MADSIKLQVIKALRLLSEVLVSLFLFSLVGFILFGLVCLLVWFFFRFLFWQLINCESALNRVNNDITNVQVYKNHSLVCFHCSNQRQFICKHQICFFLWFELVLQLQQNIAYNRTTWHKFNDTSHQCDSSSFELIGF